MSTPETVLIVDGTLVQTHDRRVSASSKNYRYSVNMQVVIDANTRLVVAVGTRLPQWKQDNNIVHKGVRARIEHTYLRAHEELERPA
jgi:hypothetical protein